MLSLRGIYSILSSSAQSWLSSQNSGAQQLSANIEYMKYAMGSVFAPVIEYVINLVYQLMKAIQSLVYSFSGINIFAKATASSMNKTAGSANKASKSLAGIHNEINNVSENDNSSGSGSINPSIDLSKIDNTPNRIIDAIKNGNWYEIGVTIGQKLNEAMENIPWNKIQNTVRKIGKGTAQLLNGFIAKTNWNQVGNTFAQGVNTVVYTGYEFVTTFDWKQFGKAISKSINGFFKNIDWATAGQTVSEGIKGILDTIGTVISEINWWSIGEDIWNFLANIDWGEIISKLANNIGKSLGALSQLLAGFLINAIEGMANFFNGEIEECGGDIVAGILKGIVDALLNIGYWIGENIVNPIINGFCELLGIHSPSTVFEGFGQNIIQGLFNGIQSLVESIKEIWNNIKETATEIFNSIADFLKNLWQGICDTATNIWNEILNNISNVWNTIIAKVREGVLGAWNAITSVFGNISNWFKEQFSKAWQAVKNVFSTGGTIFDGIKEGILSGLKRIVNAIISGINKVISIPFNGLNSALRSIRNANIMGLQPFSWINTISIPQIPQLAKGNVAYSPLIAQFGEYSGASTNPEITAPQNILRETFDEVLSNHEWNNQSNSSGELKQLIIQFGSTKVALEIERLLQQARRQNGTATVTI